ncbi:MAG: S41 family peptidase [Pseudomonadota bacterium]
MKTFSVLTVGIGLLVASVSAVAESNPTTQLELHVFDIPAPAVADRIQGLSTIWAEAKFSFAFFDQVPELDWDAAHHEYITRVVEAETMYAYYRELQAFIALLQDGHTGVAMPSSIRMDIVPLWFEVIDGRFIVHRAEIDLLERVPLGSEVVAVGGMDVRAYVEKEVIPDIAQSTVQAREKWASNALLSASHGEPSDFTILTPDGDRREITSPAVYYYTDDTAYVPPMPSRELAVEWLSDDIAKVTIPTFADLSLPDQFDVLVPELETARAIIIDLSNNGGGHTSAATGVLRHFADRSLNGSKWTTREHRASHRVWGYYGQSDLSHYGQLDAWTEPENMPSVEVTSPGVLAGKPLAILTSTLTASTAEDFLIYADPLEHVTRVGQPTFGSTGQPWVFELPGGGRARICTKRDTWQDGTDFVGVGIEPHIPVARTVEDIRDGSDPMLEAAVDHLNQQLADLSRSG